MHPQPLLLPSRQRAVLAEFERLHEAWRRASEAADEVDSCFGSDTLDVHQVLRQRLAADCLHRQAMRLLRDAPI
jgi:hypothetical protein